MDPPHILFLDHTGSLGGAQLSLLRLLQQLEMGGRFHLSVSLFSDGPLRDRIAASGIPVHILPLSPLVLQTSRYDIGKALLRLRSVGETMRYILLLAQFIRHSDADVVHTNSLKSNLIGGVAARLAKKRVIWHIHDRITRDYMPASIMYIFRYLALRMPSYVIANSQTTRELLLGDSRRPNRVIYPGTSLRAHPIPIREMRLENAVIGLVGRISPTKGHAVFLQAVPHVLQRFPTARFRIIGGALFNDAAYEKQVRGLVATLGIDVHVQFTGFINDVEEQIADLDILTVPSTVPESFGQVIAEGMAMGKPVIATGAGGALEIIAGGETGILIPPGNPVKLADAICALLGNPAAAQEMAQRGRVSVAERFSIERTGREVEQVYQHLLGRPGAA